MNKLLALIFFIVTSSHLHSAQTRDHLPACTLTIPIPSRNSPNLPPTLSLSHKNRDALKPEYVMQLLAVASQIVRHLKSHPPRLSLRERLRLIIHPEEKDDVLGALQKLREASDEFVAYLTPTVINTSDANGNRSLVVTMNIKVLQELSSDLAQSTYNTVGTIASKSFKPKKESPRRTMQWLQKEIATK